MVSGLVTSPEDHPRICLLDASPISMASKLLMSIMKFLGWWSYSGCGMRAPASIPPGMRASGRASRLVLDGLILDHDVVRGVVGQLAQVDLSVEVDVGRLGVRVVRLVRDVGVV